MNLIKMPHTIRKNNRGQISVMISVMMATFILFFAFVINTGMLVNAKINLQNAADLAAYAGASVQARQLNHISYLNYEMRRQWKKFLYRIYVLGNHCYDSFPPNQGTQGPMTYIPNTQSSSRGDLGAPTTCVFFDVNHCRLDSLPAISIPPANFMDPVTDALRGQLQIIETIRQDNCKQSGMSNLLLNTYWLYNTDPNLSAIAAVVSSGGLSATQAASIRLITSQASGLGIVPIEILLKMRVQTLQKFVNTPAQLGVTQSVVGQLLSGNAPANERTISAFNSAYYTLGNFTFNGGSVVLDELLPAQILGLKPIQTTFDTYAIDFQISTGATSACIPVTYVIGVKTPLTLGYYKDPGFLTYYAVRLKAQAQILFSPFGPLDLQAYSVAQPFGSRIGPNNNEVAFTFQGGPIGGNIPTVSVQENDPSQTTSRTGWNTRDIIYPLAKVSGIMPTANNVAQTIDPNAGYKLAMTPNPWEAKRYNIFSDLGMDAFIQNFPDPQSPTSFWAPLSATGQSTSEINSEITQAISDLTPTQANAAGSANSNFGMSANVTAALTAGLKTYIASLQQGQGETKEGFMEGYNVVRMSNPYATMPTLGVGSVFTTDPSQIKSSWNQVSDPNFAAQGRVGYSVKFVSFSSITSNPTSTDGNAALNGPLTIGDAGLDDQVFPYIKH